MDDDLQAKLARRGQINAGESVDKVESTAFNPYTEFPNFSRKEIQDYKKQFQTYDEDHSNYIDMTELTRMMEKLGHPQTHVGLKAMISEVDEDGDGQISFREFLLIFHKAAKGELTSGGLQSLAKEVNVAEEGVKGAKGFFEAHAAQQAQSNKFADEIKAEQEAKKAEAAAAKQRKAEFKEKASLWK